MLFFKKKFFPIKTTIFVHKENSYYTMNHTVEDLSLFNALRQGDPQTVAYRIQQALKLLRVSLKDYLPMLVWLVG